MTSLENIIRDALERAAIAGLCREGQVEIAFDAARRLHPDLGDDALLRLVESTWRQQARTR